MYFIHWPNPAAMCENWAELNAESWQAMEEAVKAGKIRAIGVDICRSYGSNLFTFFAFNIVKAFGSIF